MSMNIKKLILAFVITGFVAMLAFVILSISLAKSIKLNNQYRQTIDSLTLLNSYPYEHSKLTNDSLR